MASHTLKQEEEKTEKEIGNEMQRLEGEDEVFFCIWIYIIRWLLLFECVWERVRRAQESENFHTGSSSDIYSQGRSDSTYVLAVILMR